MIEAFIAFVALWIRHGVMQVEYMLFPPGSNWVDLMSAAANVVMALTAIGGAYYGLRQYRHSVRIAEFQAMFELYDRMNNLAAEIRKNPHDINTQWAFLNFAENYAAAVDLQHLTGTARHFAADLLEKDVARAIGREPLLGLVRSVRGDEEQLKHVKRLLRAMNIAFDRIEAAEVEVAIVGTNSKV